MASQSDTSLSFESQVMLVTGATRGIGRAAATLLAAHGAHVLVNGRDNANVKAVAAEIAADTGGKVSALAFDVADASETKSAFYEIATHHKRLDVLVNNAGILHDALIGMVSEDSYAQIMRTNVYGTFRCAQLASRIMARRNTGSIINMASIIGRVGNEGQSAYGASKSAVIGLTMSLAKELGPSGIRVNAIAPGFINTDMIAAVPEAKRRSIESNIRMRRIGTPHDVAKAVLFLASDLSGYVTGQTIGVDGGMII